MTYKIRVNKTVIIADTIPEWKWASAMAAGISHLFGLIEILGPENDVIETIPFQSTISERLQMLRSRGKI